MTTTWIRVRVQPTEDPLKVAKAVKNLFGEIELQVDHENEVITAKLEGVKAVKELRSRIAQDRIRNTISRVFTRWTREDELSFGLNKQSAYAGHVSLNLEGDDPMGPIQVNVKGDIAGYVAFLTEKLRGPVYTEDAV
ncbi:MAG: RNA-binding domain-containing protein [Candidatus Bathyarchaeota archaeon]